ncbi:hypothetical protein D920_00074, partial [Enterococcus faecalis 13-SD-W-01]
MVEIIKKRTKGLEGKTESEMKASVSKKLSVACLAFSLAAAPLVPSITIVYGETMESNSNEQKATEQLTEASSTETSAPEVTTADSSLENTETTSQTASDEEVKPAEEINSQESVIERETRALPLPDYQIRVGRGSTTGSYMQNSDSIPFDVIIPTSTSTLLPAGSSITINVGDSVKLSDLNVVSIPANAEITTDATAGTITITFKTEVNQDGQLAVSFEAKAVTPGIYTIKASSPQWGGDMAISDHEKITILPYVSTTNTWGKTYWDLTGKALDGKGVVQASRAGIGYTVNDAIFNNNGDYTPITATLDLTNGTNGISTPPP